MEPAHALVLDNWFPHTGGCQTRKGSKLQYDLANGTTIESLSPWNSSTPKLYAAAGTSFYDLNTGSAVVTGLGSAKFQEVNYTTQAGTFSWNVNGVDNPIVVTNTGSIVRITSGAGIDQISGVDPALFSNVTLHNKRLLFVETNSTRTWYLPVNQYYGTVGLFDFGASFALGGKLVAIGSWTVDSGFGIDDLLVGVSSEGEVAIYKGTDIDSDFSLIGTFYFGKVLGNRCITKYGSDLVILTTSGPVLLTEYLVSADTKTNQSEFSGIIQPLFNTFSSSAFDFFGWQVISSPRDNQLLVNIPNALGQSSQLVMNTITRAWCTFSGWSASVFATFKDRIYFANKDKVYVANEGNKDNVLIDGSGGTRIAQRAQPAFNFFKSPGVVKRVTLFSPQIFVTGGFRYGTKTIASYNLNYTVNLNTQDQSVFTGLIWDQGNWDEEVWANTEQSIKKWHNGAALGNGISIVMASESEGQAIWPHTNMMVETGNGLF
jgi:hypothetical protein